MLRIMTTASGIIIGDEILGGKVEDTNAHRLIAVLHEVGVELVRLVTIGDDPRAIADEVARCRRSTDHVITSGGVGPTHDDRTMEGVALAFGVPVVHHPELEQIVRRHFGDRLNDAALKLAEVPQGAGLLASGDRLLPVVRMENVFILPGIPQLFEAKLQRVRAELTGTVGVLHSLYLDADESTFAEHLTRVDADFPTVRIGSYPRLDHTDHQVRVTVESRDPAAAGQALQRLTELIAPSMVVRVVRDES